MESRIQSQPIVPSEIGATQGRSRRSRTIHLPGKSRISANARMFAPTSTIACETMANTNVFRRDVRNWAVPTMAAKFFSPTKFRVRLPAVMSLTL
jgi:hypothetical protein